MNQLEYVQLSSRAKSQSRGKETSQRLAGKQGYVVKANKPNKTDP